MVRYFVLPYSSKSEGAKAIAEALPDGKRIKLENSEYIHSADDMVVNWGNGVPHIKVPVKGTFLNRNPNIAINKKDFFIQLQGKGVTPAFATTKEEALRHLMFPIVCRTKLEGADGVGIKIANKPDELVAAPLYTSLIDKFDEYRVHVGRNFKGEVHVICSQKKRIIGALDNPAIWTGKNVVLDWCDAVPDAVLRIAKETLALLPTLDFGGFDVIRDRRGNAYVVEVNSAPMMTPDTAKRYAKFFMDYVAARDAGKPAPVAKAPARVAPPVVGMGAAVAGREAAIEKVLADLRALLMA